MESDFCEFTFLGAVEVFILSADKKEVLLMKRSESRKVLPGFYAGLGGKMDKYPIETPIETATREIYEESGISSDKIDELKFKAIFAADDKYGKWFIFEFVSILKDNKFIFEDRETDEGILTWKNIHDLDSLNLIPDLRKGVLEKILFSETMLWIKSIYNKSNILENLFINSKQMIE